MVSCFLTFPLTRMDPSGVQCLAKGSFSTKTGGVWDQFTDLPIGKQPTLPPESVK